MPSAPSTPFRYTNPVVDADLPDPDAIRLPDGRFALVASSFDRLPGLPLWRSDDLLDWVPVGFAGGSGPAVGSDGGVWAPSIRMHDGRLYLVWGDPDRGIFVTTADDIEGPWTEPQLVVPGRGLIDPCPYWDAEGRAFLVHAWARSRAGFANRLSVVEMSPDLAEARSDPAVLIDGDGIEGCSVLEGPKVYDRAGEVWVFAPAGGVSTGWQYAFRADSLAGPWRERVVLEQGTTSVNGPHQGAWVVGAESEEWFLHFQDKEHLGRVLHLQPLRWDGEGWPLIGRAVTGGPPEPVPDWPTPGGGAAPPPRPALGDDFRSRRLSSAWHSRGARREDLVGSTGDGTLTLRPRGDGLVARPLDGRLRRLEIEVMSVRGVSACLVLDGATRAALETDGAVVRLLRGTADTMSCEWSAPAPVENVILGAEFSDASVSFTVNGVAAGPPVGLAARRWTGVEVGLMARGGDGTATFGPLKAVSA